MLPEIEKMLTPETCAATANTKEALTSDLPAIDSAAVAEPATATAPPVSAKEHTRFELPILEKPRAIRLKFRKVGDLQYISHLDLQRTFSRVLVRSGLPLWYTMGFNPHLKMTFAMPLSVGAQSEREYLDLRLTRDIACAEVKEILNREVTDEMRILDVYEPVNSLTDIGWASYRMDIQTTGADNDLAAKMETLLRTPPVLMTKHGKGGDREVDITEMIKSVTVECENGHLICHALLAASDSHFCNPELLVGAWKKAFGILSGDANAEFYDIVRTEVYLTDGVTVFR